MTYAPFVMTIQRSIDTSSRIVKNVKTFGKQYFDGLSRRVYQVYQVYYNISYWHSAGADGFATHQLYLYDNQTVYLLL